MSYDKLKLMQVVHTSILITQHDRHGMICVYSVQDELNEIVVKIHSF